MPRSNRSSIKKRLLAQAAKERQNLTILLSGASIFFLGLGMIYFSEHYFESSLQQEIIALLGLLFAVVGGILGAIGYCCLSILRIFKLINDD